MLNPLVRRSVDSLRAGVSVVCLGLLSLSVVCGLGERAIAAPVIEETILIWPEAEDETGQRNVGLDEISQGINAEFKGIQNPTAKPDELALESIPVVGALLDEEGKFDWGMDLPVTFDFGDLIGEPVLIVGTDFPID